MGFNAFPCGNVQSLREEVNVDQSVLLKKYGDVVRHPYTSVPLHCHFPDVADPPSEETSVPQYIGKRSGRTRRFSCHPYKPNERKPVCGTLFPLPFPPDIPGDPSALDDYQHGKGTIYRKAYLIKGENLLAFSGTIEVIVGKLNCLELANLAKSALDEGRPVLPHLQTYAKWLNQGGNINELAKGRWKNSHSNNERSTDIYYYQIPGHPPQIRGPRISRLQRVELLLAWWMVKQCSDLAYQPVVDWYRNHGWVCGYHIHKRNRPSKRSNDVQ